MTIHARAFTPVQNPTYLYNQSDEFKQTTPQPRNVLDTPPPAPRGTDRRLTSAGTQPPVAGLPAYVPAAYQTPYNVWALYPA